MLAELTWERSASDHSTFGICTIMERSTWPQSPCTLPASPLKGPLVFSLLYATQPSPNPRSLLGLLIGVTWEWGEKDPLDNCQPVGKGINAPPSVLWEHSVESTLTTSQGVPKGWRLHCSEHWSWAYSLLWMLLHPCLPWPCYLAPASWTTSHINSLLPFLVTSFAFGMIQNRHIMGKVSVGHSGGPFLRKV